MASTAQHLRIIRDGLERHVAIGALPWEFRDLIRSYARALEIELTPEELASLLRRS